MIVGGGVVVDVFVGIKIVVGGDRVDSSKNRGPGKQTKHPCEELVERSRRRSGGIGRINGR